MKSILKKFETTMAAAAFAEEGEFDTARQIMQEEVRTTDRPVKRDQQRPAARKEVRAN